MVIDAHLGLLQNLARDVERQVLRVDHALEEGEPARQQLLLEGVRDEDALHVELDRLDLRVRQGAPQVVMRPPTMTFDWIGVTCDPVAIRLCGLSLSLSI